MSFFTSDSVDTVTLQSLVLGKIRSIVPIWRQSRTHYSEGETAAMHCIIVWPETPEASIFKGCSWNARQGDVA
jgi:hypothetical protein